MKEQLSVRNGSKLSGQKPGSAEFDLNRQMTQSLDPQGMYIFGADGTPYGFANDHEPADIARLMDMALKRFHAKPPKPVAITTAEKTDAFSITPPATAQVLQVFARIPSPPKTSTFLNNGVGRDFCWIYQEERQEMLKQAQRTAIGKTFSLPTSLARRIARFHLVDDVRGTPNMWEASELRHIDVNATVIAANTLKIAGSFDLKAGSKRGFNGTIEGNIILHPQTGEWTRVRMLADGRAFGAGTYTPNQPPTPYRLLVGFLNTGLAESRVVPPEEVATYNRDTRYHKP
jgi:hypothetical protein